MIRIKKNVGMVRTKQKKITRTKKKMSRIKGRKVRCKGVHMIGNDKRFFAPPNHFSDKPFYLNYDEAIHLKIKLEKLYYANFKIKTYGKN